DGAPSQEQLARARHALLVARNDRHNAALALHNAIGASEADDVAPTDTPVPAATIVTVDTALAAARSDRPELKEMAAREKEASLALATARARLVPSVAVDFVGDMSGNHSDDMHWTRR